MAEGPRGRQDANFSGGRSKPRSAGRHRVFLTSHGRKLRNAHRRARKQPVIILSRRGCSICRRTSASPASSLTTTTSSTTSTLPSSSSPYNPALYSFTAFSRLCTKKPFRPTPAIRKKSTNVTSRGFLGSFRATAAIFQIVELF